MEGFTFAPHLCRGVKSHAVPTLLRMEGFRVVLALPYTLKVTVVI